MFKLVVPVSSKIIARRARGTDFAVGGQVAAFKNCDAIKLLSLWHVACQYRGWL